MPLLFQHKKFRDILAGLISKINSDQGSSIEIIDEIKKELKKELPSIYEEWENSGFNINFKFELQYPTQGIIKTTLLHLATLGQSIPCTSIIRYLLNTVANLNLQNSEGKTPLYMAAITDEDKNKDIVELLLRKRADPNIAASCGQTPLHVACMFCGGGFNVEIIKLLLKSGADINKKDNKGNTPLHQLVDTSMRIQDNSPLEEQSLKLVELFIKHGANIYTKDKSRDTPKDLIRNMRLSTLPMNRGLANSIEQFLEEQESSREYHRKLLELLEQTKDLKFLTEIIVGNGVMSIKGIQVCSQAIPKILGISGIEIAVKGTIVEGEIEEGFSHGTGWPTVDVEGNPLKYYDLFNRFVSFFETNSVIEKLPHPKPDFLGCKVRDYVIDNLEAIKQEFWGEVGNNVSSSLESLPMEEEKDLEKLSKPKNSSPQGTDSELPCHYVKKKKTESKNETDAQNFSMTGNYGRILDLKKPLGGPPSNKQKASVAIAIGVVTALATALICYSIQLPALAVVIASLIAGVGAYIVSSKLYDVSICNGAGQQPGL